VLTPAGREAKSPKCGGGSEAGLEVDSPGRRYCLTNFLQMVYSSSIVRYFLPVFLSLFTGLTSNKITSATDIRNQVIDQLMAIKDAGYLRALSDMINSSRVQEAVVPLTEEQKIILVMSEEDIKAGRTIDQPTLNERELEWLNRK